MTHQMIGWIRTQAGPALGGIEPLMVAAGVLAQGGQASAGRPTLTGPFFGAPLPGTVPEPFGPGSLSNGCGALGLGLPSGLHLAPGDWERYVTTQRRPYPAGGRSA